MKAKVVLITISAVLIIIFFFILMNKTHAKEMNDLIKTNENYLAQVHSKHYKEKTSIETQLDIADKIILDKESRIMELVQDVEKWKEYLGVKKTTDNIVATLNNSTNYKVTAYDLSVASCGKKFNDRSYGKTANGTSLKGLDLRSASTISTDPSVIPLGSIVYLYFTNPKAKQYNGLYISNDTGSAIKGSRIDLFFGDYKSTLPAKEALEFGIQEAKAVVLQ